MNFRSRRQTFLKRVFTRGGFTLMETSIGVSITLTLSLVLVSMLQQHITFMGWISKQSFLTTEAPQIGNLIGRIFGSADHYFVYSSRANALAGEAPVLQNGGAVRLFSQSATGEVTELWVTVDTVNGERLLQCHSELPDGVQRSWIVCKGLDNATFHCNTGVLGVTLNGPNGEVISYYGESR